VTVTLFYFFFFYHLMTVVIWLTILSLYFVCDRILNKSKITN